MSLKIGIVGLPNAGKSTLFNALIKKQQAKASNFPFTTIDPNIGVVDVPDDRLSKIAVIAQSAKIIPTAINFVDIAGLVKDAHKGEGLGNKFLANIREVDAIALVVRAFIDPNVIHVLGTIDPITDIETILTELALADLEIVDKRLEKLAADIKSQDKLASREQTMLMEIRRELAKNFRLNPDQIVTISQELKLFSSNSNLFSLKPLIFILNVDEDQIKDQEALITAQIGQNLTLFDHHGIVAISAKIESELAQLNNDDRQEYLNSLGILESGLDLLVKKTYQLLNLITFFTAGPKETRAWTVTRGTKAPRAAGKIHSDFERGFIRAEIISFDDYINFKGEAGARQAGKLRSEGKDYIIQDGNVVHFRFNV